MAKWTNPTRSHSRKVVAQFKVTLEDVAQSFAEHERVDSVSVKHVNEAFSALARLGLESKTFWQRTDTWTGLGAFLFGFAFSMPSACGIGMTFFGFQQTAINAASFISMSVLALAGGMLFFWAKYHGGVPKKRGSA